MSYYDDNRYYRRSQSASRESSVNPYYTNTRSHSQHTNARRRYHVNERDMLVSYL